MIARTFDYRKVKKLLNHQMVISRKIIYLLDDDIGLWSFHKYLDGLMIHADMTLKCRGKRAIESAFNAFKWIFSNTDHEVIYAEIPFDKQAASYVATQSGMKYTHSDNDNRFYEVKKWEIFSKV